MNSVRGQVHLGDLVRAAVALNVTEPAEVAAIAATMGLGGRSGLDGVSGERGRGAEPGRAVGETFGPGPESGSRVAVPGLAESSAPGDDGISVLALRGPTTAAAGGAEIGAEAEVGAWAGAGGADPGETDLLLDPGAGRTLTPDPVWPARWAPGVMFAAASTDVASRTVDERSLARRVAARPYAPELRFRVRPTTRLGIQLLLDGGESMLPFRDDQRWLRELAGGVVGRDRVAVLRFRGTPLRGVRRVGRRGWAPYPPPVAGTPVVLVSDLGLRRMPFSGDAAAGGAEWTDWLDGVSRTGCPVVCLTPYEARAHPWAIRRRISLVPLDRRTSIRSAWRETRRLRGEVLR